MTETPSGIFLKTFSLIFIESHLISTSTDIQNRVQLKKCRIQTMGVNIIQSPPAVNPAVYTALVVHDMALEGTVDQDAHIVAKEIEDTDHE